MNSFAVKRNRSRNRNRSWKRNWTDVFPYNEIKWDVHSVACDARKKPLAVKKSQKKNWAIFVSLTI